MLLMVPVQREVYIAAFELIFHAIDPECRTFFDIDSICLKNSAKDAQFAFFNQFKLDICMISSPLITTKQIETAQFDKLLR